MRTRSRIRNPINLCEPAAMLPAQLRHAGTGAQRGELRLVAALFEDALRCVVRNANVRGGQRWRDFVQACRWFEDDRRDWPFAFANVCELLALDAGQVRGYVDRIVSRSRRFDSDHS